MAGGQSSDNAAAAALSTTTNSGGSSNGGGGGGGGGKLEPGRDRYGLLGLLPVIRMADHDLSALALGSDLTSLGLNLTSPDVLYPKFVSPWAEGPPLPPCYTVKNVLPIQKVVGQVPDDTLFYLFYSKPGDILQQAAGSLLYNRDWRYHKEHKVWITRPAGTKPTQTTSTYESGTYICFDPHGWKKVTREMVLRYDQLEDRQAMPQRAPQ